MLKVDSCVLRFERAISEISDQGKISVFIALMTVFVAQWLSGRVLDSRPMGREFKPHQHHCLVSLSKTH